MVMKIESNGTCVRNWERKKSMLVEGIQAFQSSSSLPPCPFRKCGEASRCLKNQMWQWGAVVVLCSSNLIDIIMMHCLLCVFFKKARVYIFCNFFLL